VIGWFYTYWTIRMTFTTDDSMLLPIGGISEARLGNMAVEKTACSPKQAHSGSEKLRLRLQLGN